MCPLPRIRRYLATLSREHYSGSSPRPTGDLAGVATDDNLTTPDQEPDVPKSQVRKKKVYTPPAEMQQRPRASTRKPSPVWIPALAVTLIFAGIIYLVTYYLTQGFSDVKAFSALADLRYWNLGIGFGALIAALLLLSKWR
jgi:hypothetical protein